jgi:hypothetical protein
MLTRVLFALVLTCGVAGVSSAEETKLVGLGIAVHEVTEAVLEKGEALPAPKFNTPAVAYVLAANLKKGDTVEIDLKNGDKSLLRNTETLAEDRARVLLQAGKRGVPAGGWPEGTYHAEAKITRDGKTLISKQSKPMIFE